MGQLKKDRHSRPRLKYLEEHRHDRGLRSRPAMRNRRARAILTTAHARRNLLVLTFRQPSIDGDTDKRQGCRRSPAAARASRAACTEVPSLLASGARFECRSLFCFSVGSTCMTCSLPRPSSSALVMVPIGNIPLSSRCCTTSIAGGCKLIVRNAHCFCDPAPLVFFRPRHPRFVGLTDTALNIGGRRLCSDCAAHHFQAPKGCSAERRRRALSFRSRAGDRSPYAIARSCCSCRARLNACWTGVGAPPSRRHHDGMCCSGSIERCRDALAAVEPPDGIAADRVAIEMRSTASAASSSNCSQCTSIRSRRKQARHVVSPMRRCNL